MGSLYYCYDANGNMTRRERPSPGCSGQEMFYDAENRLTQVVSGTITTTYKYDGDGARVSKTITVSGVTTTTYYIGSHYEITSTGGQTGITKYYYFGSQRVAMRTAAGVTYLHSDHLGSSNVASNGSGALISRQTYFPFGAPRASDTAQMTSVTDFGFTGQKLDASDGLMYYNARYYDAALGRFTQPDTIIPNLYNPQSLNRYSYVLNNPLKYVDPTGHSNCYTYDDGECADPPPDPIEPECHGLKCKWDDPGSNTPPEQTVYDIFMNPKPWQKDLLFTLADYLKTHPDYDPYADDTLEYDQKAYVIHAKAYLEAKKQQDQGIKVSDENLAKLWAALAGVFIANGGDHPPDGSMQIGRPSTGRTTPKNLKEQLAMEAVKADPKGMPLDVDMTDPNWTSSEGWVKMGQNVNGVEIHYNHNTVTGKFGDFKFK